MQSISSYKKHVAPPSGPAEDTTVMSFSRTLPQKDVLAGHGIVR
jgi:hypothetical protein